MSFSSIRILTLAGLLLLSAASAMGGNNAKKNKDKLPIKEPLTPDPYPAMQLDQPLRESPLTNSSTRGPINNLPGGIDVSHYQGTINWASVAASGKVGYAYVKASESVSFVDDYYQYNMVQGRKHGINMGSYHFYRAHVDQDAQFRHMISVIDPAKQDLVPVIDVESANGVSVETFASRLRRFLKRVEDYYGKPPILYTYVNFYNKYLAYRGFEHYPLFIAFYQDNAPRVDDGNRYIMWQYTSKGRISGINGDVDRSKFMNGHTIYDIIYP
ncbi:MAG: glycoside hydrolase family 25 protein [Bacteroidaceae bacterium]|nr:glycoside hydrolase family 25 protein [Bacteroidaceae bacterium]